MGERDLRNLTVIGGDAGLESLQLSHQSGYGQTTRQDHRGIVGGGNGGGDGLDAFVNLGWLASIVLM
jgi:hypothetical protein